MGKGGTVKKVKQSMERNSERGNGERTRNGRDTDDGNGSGLSPGTRNVHSPDSLVKGRGWLNQIEKGDRFMHSILLTRNLIKLQHTGQMEGKDRKYISAKC